MQAETCRIRQFGDRDAVGEAFVHEFEHNASCLRSKTAGACLLVSVLFNNELRDSGDCLPQLRVGAVTSAAQRMPADLYPTGFHIDHIIPRQHGGATDFHNLFPVEFGSWR